MAAVIRYINTASTAGGDGTTNATSGANRAYPSMAAWYTAEKTDLVSDGDTHTVRCAAGIDSAGAIVISSSDWTTDATHFITIEPVSGDEHGGVYGEGIFSVRQQVVTQAFYLSVPYTVIRGITIKNTSTSSNARCVHNNAHCTWDSCFSVQQRPVVTRFTTAQMMEVMLSTVARLVVTAGFVHLTMTTQHGLIIRQLAAPTDSGGKEHPAHFRHQITLLMVMLQRTFPGRLFRAAIMHPAIRRHRGHHP